MIALNELWGGTLCHFEFDVAEHSARLDVETLDAGVSHRFTLAFEGISELQFVDNSRSTWDWAELTSVEAEAKADGMSTEVRIAMWRDDTTLTITAAVVRMNGKPIG
ncbi:MAG: hypothetical protein WC538_15815 [Thermoanaerobaculia bacterium]|jgi:hypothetical protein